jgi:hypothetical protein
MAVESTDSVLFLEDGVSSILREEGGDLLLETSPNRNIDLEDWSGKVLREDGGALQNEESPNTQLFLENFLDRYLREDGGLLLAEAAPNEDIWQEAFVGKILLENSDLLVAESFQKYPHAVDGTGAGTETLSTTAIPTATDTGIGTELGSSPASPSDSGAGSEFVSYTASVPATDSGGELTYRRRILADSPSSYWKLDETAGASSITDEIGGITGTPTAVTFGQSSAIDVTSALLDDDSDTIDLGDNYGFDGTPSFSVEFWFKASLLAAAGIVSKIHSVSDGWAVLLEGGSNKVVFNRTVGFAQVSAYGRVPVVGEWTHVVSTYDSPASFMSTYINGVLVGQGLDTRSLPVVTEHLCIGALTALSQPSLHGNIDEVAIYSGIVLTAAQALAHYQHGIAIAIDVTPSSTGAGSEAHSVTAVVGNAENGAGSEATSVLAVIGLTDSGAGSESTIYYAAVPSAESGVGTTTTSYIALVGPSENGAGSEAHSTLAIVGLTDSATGDESTSYSALIPSGETGAGSESTSIFIPSTTPTSADSGVGTEIAGVVVVGQIGGFIEPGLVHGDHHLRLPFTGRGRTAFDKTFMEITPQQYSPEGDEGTGQETTSVMATIKIYEIAKGTDTLRLWGSTQLDAAKGAEEISIGMFEDPESELKTLLYLAESGELRSEELAVLLYENALRRR